MKKDTYIRIRLSSQDKDRLKAIAADRGTTITDVITDWIRDNKQCDNNVLTKIKHAGQRKIANSKPRPKKIIQGEPMRDGMGNAYVMEHGQKRYL